MEEGPPNDVLSIHKFYRYYKGTHQIFIYNYLHKIQTDYEVAANQNAKWFGFLLFDSNDPLFSHYKFQ